MLVSEAIKHDHRELETYYENCLNATDTDTKARWQNQLIWELARHSVAEEIVVYPVMPKAMEGRGAEFVKKDLAAHDELKTKLKELEQLKPDDSKFTPTLKSLFATLKDHINDEETHDLPELEKSLPSDESQRLAKSFERTKLFVPTRPHPSAPNKPPFETVVGLMTAPIDKLKDMFAAFPNEDTPGKQPPSKPDVA